MTFYSEKLLPMDLWRYLLQQIYWVPKKLQFTNKVLIVIILKIYISIHIKGLYLLQKANEIIVQIKD